jgi:protoporphyrinogen IX oxidase
MSTLFEIKALHIIFVVTWFAGLFYIVRLFVYQAEAKERPQNEQDVLIPQYQLMAKRLWYGITWPSMILATTFGTWMIIDQPALLTRPWMHIKLSFVAGLIIYHFICHAFFKKLQSNSDTRTGNFYRIWNEVATLFLVAIVFLVILKENGNWWLGTICFILFGFALMLAIKIYKRLREKK